MQLINYLKKHFYSRGELLTLSETTGDDLSKWQHQALVPHCSYKLTLNINSCSFFGEYTNEETVEYYAKGYVSWLTTIKNCHSHQEAYEIFAKRYQNKLEQLYSVGHLSNINTLNDNLHPHIKSEWQYFLDGTYGLCTRSGLPEDIAAKELAISEIKTLTQHKILNTVQLTQLKKAVDLLDAASALFAPHERLKSSRHLLIDEVRRDYGL